MAAKDYVLAVSPLTNTVWICKPSKRDKDEMTDDRIAVDKSKFIAVLLEWAHNQIDGSKDTLNITSDGKVVAEIKINRKALGLNKGVAVKKIKPPHPECYIYNGVPRLVFFHISDKTVRLILPTPIGALNKIRVSSLTPCTREEYNKYHNEVQSSQDNNATP